MGSIVPLLPSLADDLGVSVATGIDRAGSQPVLLALAVTMLGFAAPGWVGVRRPAF